MELTKQDAFSIRQFRINHEAIKSTINNSLLKHDSVFLQLFRKLKVSELKFLLPGSVSLKKTNKKMSSRNLINLYRMELNCVPIEIALPELHVETLPW